MTEHRLLRATAIAMCAGACALPSCTNETNEPRSGEPSLAKTRAASSETADVLDWLIQDVCDVDPTRDPYPLPVDDQHCPAWSPTHNLQPGEILYYNRVADTQVRNSFPSPLDNEVVINTFDFGVPNVWDNDFDGHDIIEASPPYVSITDTRDPCGLSQSWVRWKDNVVGGTLDFNDSWILFPTKLPAYATTDGVNTRGTQLNWEINREARNQPKHCCREPVPTPTTGPNAGECRRRVQGPCDPHPDPLYSPPPPAPIDNCVHPDIVARSTWSRTMHTFTGGQQLETIVSTHYYQLPNDAMGKEVFYFTRLYGLTRWESWKVNPTHADGSTCNGSGVNFDQEAGGRWFVRDDCRDGTEIVPNPSGFDPRDWPATVPKVRTEQWEAEGQGMSHATGGAYGDGWGVGTGPDNAGHMLYGPYTSALLPSQRYTASYTLNVDHNASSATAATIDVRNATSGSVLSSRAINRTEFEKTFTYQDFTTDFMTSAVGGQHEFRLWWHDNTGMVADRVRVGEPRSDWSYVFPPQTTNGSGPLWHDVGWQGYAPWDSWWYVDTNSFPAGYLAFSPLIDNIYPGARKATWRLEVTARASGVFAGTPVALLEIYETDLDTTYLATSRTILRDELPLNQTRPMSISFNGVGTHRYSFKLWWYGNTRLWAENLVVE